MKLNIFTYLYHRTRCLANGSLSNPSREETSTAELSRRRIHSERGERNFQGGRRGPTCTGGVHD